MVKRKESYLYASKFLHHINSKVHAKICCAYKLFLLYARSSENSVTSHGQNQSLSEEDRD